MHELLERLGKLAPAELPSYKLADFIYLLLCICLRSAFFNKNRKLHDDLYLAALKFELHVPLFEGQLHLTPEQQAIVQASFDKTTDIIKVIAYAGSGKTTTLAAYARARPTQRFLYVTFNVSLNEEAAFKFPPNVVARNIHKVSFIWCGSPTSHDLIRAMLADYLPLFIHINRLHFRRAVGNTRAS